MQNYNTVTNTTLRHIIDEYIHSERDRQIMRRKLIDGYTYERIAEEMEMSPRQIKTIVKRHSAVIWQNIMKAVP